MKNSVVYLSTCAGSLALGALCLWPMASIAKTGRQLTPSCYLYAGDGDNYDKAPPQSPVTCDPGSSINVECVGGWVEDTLNDTWGTDNCHAANSSVDAFSISGVPDSTTPPDGWYQVDTGLG